jgi:hypothetical protein
MADAIENTAEALAKLRQAKLRQAKLRQASGWSASRPR